MHKNTLPEECLSGIIDSLNTRVWIKFEVVIIVLNKI
jgi:hypothetical protein